MSPINTLTRAGQLLVTRKSVHAPTSRAVSTLVPETFPVEVALFDDDWMALLSLATISVYLYIRRQSLATGSYATTKSKAARDIGIHYNTITTHTERLKKAGLITIKKIVTPDQVYTHIFTPVQGQSTEETN